MIPKLNSLTKTLLLYRNYFAFSIIDQPQNNQTNRRPIRNNNRIGENQRRYGERGQQEFSQRPRRNFQSRFQNNKNIDRRQQNQNPLQMQFRQKQQRIKMNRKLTQTQFSQFAQKQIDRTQEQQQQKQVLNRDQDLKAIDTINKYFQGLRINTKYAKFYNQDKFQNAIKHTKSKLSDIPFSLESNVKNSGLESLKVSSVASNILKKYDRRKLQKKLKQISSNYFTDLINQERKVKIQPNFQRQARRSIASLKNAGYKFKLSPKQKFELTIQQIVVYKGLEVIRNNNLSIDSYQVINHQQYKEYKLWQRGAYKIPEQQWHTKRNMLMQIKALVECPHVITIKNPSQPKSKQSEGDSKIYNQIVFQINLRQPPKFSQFRLTTEQFLKDYEVNDDQIYITNVDNRNSYFNFAFEENQKKNKLINKLV